MLLLITPTSTPAPMPADPPAARAPPMPVTPVSALAESTTLPGVLTVTFSPRKAVVFSLIAFTTAEPAMPAEPPNEPPTAMP